ncbi:MAG TPA: hypothetical protein VE687_02965, partial [Stellaceae bacterium]|nr:hypothetical protein [Stellaceae bacterium]
MQKRGLIPLVAATVVLVALAIFAVASSNRGVSRAASGRPAFPALAAKLDDVASVSIMHDGSSLSFVRDGDSWLVSERGNYPANAAKVRQLMLTMADLA